MKVQLDNFEKIGVPYVRYFNGRFDGIQSELDSDGIETYQLVRQYKFAEMWNVGLMAPIDALNYKLQKMKDFDFALNLDTDEYLDGSWQDFESSLREIQRDYNGENIIAVSFEDKTGVYADMKLIHKLYHKPEEMEIKYAHMWFFEKNTDKKIIPKIAAKGITIIQDDAPRPDWRERMQCRFQQMNRRKELGRQQEFLSIEIKKGNELKWNVTK